MDEDMIRDFEEWMKTDEGREWTEYIGRKIVDENAKKACLVMAFVFGRAYAMDIEETIDLVSRLVLGGLG